MFVLIAEATTFLCVFLNSYRATALLITHDFPASPQTLMGWLVNPETRQLEVNEVKFRMTILGITMKSSGQNINQTMRAENVTNLKRF